MVELVRETPALDHEVRIIDSVHARGICVHLWTYFSLKNSEISTCNLHSAYVLSFPPLKHEPHVPLYWVYEVWAANQKGKK